MAKCRRHRHAHRSIARLRGASPETARRSHINHGIKRAAERGTIDNRIAVSRMEISTACHLVLCDIRDDMKLAGKLMGGLNKNAFAAEIDGR